MANFHGNPQVKDRLAIMAQALSGKRIKDVRWQSDKEMTQAGFSLRSPVIVLEDNTLIIGQQDDEGNNGGPLFIYDGRSEFADIFCVCD